MISVDYQTSLNNGIILENYRAKELANSKLRWIAYSTCDEDPKSEIRALNITPDDTVLCVTGSGCRVLSLLACNPQHLIAVDYSPGQNYLLELKLAAIRNLSYDQLLQFFGVDEHPNRWEIFCSLQHQMSRDTVAYFQANRWAIDKGVLFTGQHEALYIKLVVPLTQLLFGRQLERIFRSVTLEEQRSVYQQQLASSFWRWLIRVGFSPAVFRYLLNEPHLFAEINVDTSSYVLDRLDHTFSNHLAKDNDWLYFMFYGKYPGRHCLPHFLREENYWAIRQATTKLKIVTASLPDYLKQVSDQSIDKYSLSDVSSYISRECFENMLRDVARTGKDKAQLCYRNFLAKWLAPSDLTDILHRNDELCTLLDWDDLSFAYTFEVSILDRSKSKANNFATV